MLKHHLPATATLIADALHAKLDEAFVYRGMCDASAAAALGPDLFVVANDERNQLKVYRRGTADPVEVVDLSGFLGTKAHKESDLEGAAAIGERIYWISSHGRNKKGEVQERRCRFFATEAGKGKSRLAPVGKPYTRRPCSWCTRILPRCARKRCLPSPARAGCKSSATTAGHTPRGCRKTSRPSRASP